MMNEIEAIKKAVNPQETLFVVDSMTGQDAVNIAKSYVFVRFRLVKKEKKT